MRNLTLIATESSSFADLNLTSTAIDLDENVIYAASEQQTLDGEVAVELWRVAQLNSDHTISPTAVTMFTSVPSSNGPSETQILSLRVVAELRRIVSIMRGGDVVVVSLEEEDSPAEVEGTFESGILAAAWNPDESLLAIITGEQKLVLMTSALDVLSETPLHADEFGEDAPINVGWGSKQTQFHGSLGKTAAQAPSITKVGSSPDDDNQPRISWRGDGAFFVVSSLSPEDANGLRHRTLRVYDRQAALQSTSEAVPGLEHPLVWRPSGNLIVGTQRFGFEGGGAGKEGRHDVVFFERNGLRHGEFNLRVEHLGGKVEGVDSGYQRRWGYQVRELDWNADSNVLSVWIEGDDGDIVQLWSTGNYHWYLKHEIAAPLSPSGQPGRFTSVSWHPEVPLYLLLTTQTQLIQRKYAWDTFVSRSQPPNDSGTVAVLDGSTILLTPFRVQNVPPPMSSYQLVLASPPSASDFINMKTPIHISLSSQDDILAVLWESGYLELWSLNTRIGSNSGPVMAPKKILSGYARNDTTVQWRQIALQNPADTLPTIVVLGTSSIGTDVIARLHVNGNDVTNLDKMACPRNCRLLNNSPDIYQTPKGDLIKYGSDSPFTSFPEFCLQIETVILPSKEKDGLSNSVFIGLGKSGQLNAAKANSEPSILSGNVTSFTVASNFVIYTTNTHEAIFVPVKELSNFKVGDAASTTTLSRKLERGSRIVTAVPSSMSLVLQMPRGNLETINPRPLVMEVVKQDLDAGNYRKAFFACRKHRIELNVLVDHDQATFLEQASSFVNQIPEVDHLNLFLTSIGRGSQSQDIITKVSDAIRLELEKIDLAKYINTILTAHVVKTPPDHEAGLLQLLRLRESDPNLVEEAVKYIIFLVDADRLFDTALGMYDFSLVLMIAQHAQKDPREYLPFLRELRALDKYYQRFRIDDHLKRYQSALRNLSLAVPKRFDEAVSYIELHRLYELALSIWKNTDRFEAILELYGDWLFERREFKQAAEVFVEANKISKAMVSYEKCLQWQELFNLAVLENVGEEKLVEMGYRVAEDLVSKKRHSDAGRVLLDYSKDTREAVIAFVQGNMFSEARRIATLSSKAELLEDVIHPAAFESRAQLSEEVGEMQAQLRKQVDRLRELRIKKEEEPDVFYGTEDVALQNIDVMTDVSMPATAFTRYTVAPTATSRSSKRSSRSKRKAERKVGSGRKGTVDEEEYLLKSIAKLVERFTAAQGEARNLLPHLFQITPDHRREGQELQKEISDFEAEFRVAVEDIWARPVTGGDAEVPAPDTWLTRMEEAEKKKQINPIDKVSKPDLSQGKGWRMNLFDME